MYLTLRFSIDSAGEEETDSVDLGSASSQLRTTSSRTPACATTEEGASLKGETSSKRSTHSGGAVKEMSNEAPSPLGGQKDAQKTAKKSSKKHKSGAKYKKNPNAPKRFRR